MTYRERSREDATLSDRIRTRVGRWLFMHGFPRLGLSVVPGDVR